MPFLQETHLENTRPGHNKEYNVATQQIGKTYVVIAAWGPMGDLRGRQKKYEGPNLSAANAQHANLVSAKQSGGYSVIPGRRTNITPEPDIAALPVATSVPLNTITPSQAAANAKVQATVLPTAKIVPPKAERARSGVSLQTPVQMKSQAVLEYLLDDTEHVLESKENGRRIGATVLAGQAIGSSKDGFITAIPPDVAAELVRLSPSGVTLWDGELITVKITVRENKVDVVKTEPRFRVWQMLGLDGRDLRHQPYMDRRRAVPDLTRARYVELVTQAHGAKAKRELYNQIVAGRGEGVVLKLGFAVHADGDNDSWQKWKLIGQADVELGATTKEKASLPMYVRDEAGKRVAIGNVTIPPNKTALFKPGVVAQVLYLYAEVGSNKLVQPRLDPALDAPRVDKQPEQCLLTQLKYRGDKEESDA